MRWRSPSVWRLCPFLVAPMSVRCQQVCNEHISGTKDDPLFVAPAQNMTGTSSYTGGYREFKTMTAMWDIISGGLLGSIYQLIPFMVISHQFLRRTRPLFDVDAMRNDLPSSDGSLGSDWLAKSLKFLFYFALVVAGLFQVATSLTMIGWGLWQLPLGWYFWAFC